MSTDDEGVTLPEVNRNVIDLRRQLEGMSTRYVPLVLWEENRKNTGERLGIVENDVATIRAERRTSAAAFQTSFLYPLLMLLIGAGLTYLLTRGG